MSKPPPTEAERSLEKMRFASLAGIAAEEIERELNRRRDERVQNRYVISVGDGTAEAARYRRMVDGVINGTRSWPQQPKPAKISEEDAKLVRLHQDMLKAVEDDDIGAIRAALAEGARINGFQTSPALSGLEPYGLHDFGQLEPTPLGKAAQLGRTTCAAYLIQSGADPSLAHVKTEYTPGSPSAAAKQALDNNNPETAFAILELELGYKNKSKPAEGHS